MRPTSTSLSPNKRPGQVTGVTVVTVGTINIHLDNENMGPRSPTLYSTSSRCWESTVTTVTTVPTPQPTVTQRFGPRLAYVHCEIAATSTCWGRRDMTPSGEPAPVAL